MLQRTQTRHFISLRSNITMLEQETVAKLQKKVVGLRAEKAQLEDKCFYQDVEIALTQTNIGWIDQVGESCVDLNISSRSFISGSLGPGRKVFLWAVRLGYVTKINWPS